MGMFNFVLDSFKGEIFGFKVKRQDLIAGTVIFEFYFRIFFFHKTKVARNYEKIKVKRSQTWPPS